MARKTLEGRFWEKVDTSAGDDGCWIWTKGRNAEGYGWFWCKQRPELAHRIAFILANGPIAGELVVDHICHNPPCVNPAHLRIVERRENAENRDGANSNSGSGVRGVFWAADRAKWRVKIAGKSYGSFSTLAEAEAKAISVRQDLMTHSEMDNPESEFYKERIAS